VSLVPTPGLLRTAHPHLATFKCISRGSYAPGEPWTPPAAAYTNAAGAAAAALLGATTFTCALPLCVPQRLSGSVEVSKGRVCAALM